MADTLKFGPQWLRALSDGGNVTSPPTSPAPTLSKYKLADHRYGREEMLALFDPGKGMPPDLLEVPFIAKEKSQKPLAVVPFSDEEMHLMSQSVNSSAVLRMTGRGAPPPGVTRGGMRGGGAERGRGRGRGRGDGFHSRGPYEDDSFGRGRYTRGESWEDGARGFERGSSGFGGRGGFDEAPPHVSPRREFSRSMSTDNWRDAKESGQLAPPPSAAPSGEEESGSDWRRAGPTRDKWGGRSWREQRESRGGFESDRGDRRGFEDYNRQPFDKDRPAFRRSRSSGPFDDEGDVPEWSTSDAGDMAGLGTFDSSGAFIKEPWRDIEGIRPDGEENWEEECESPAKNVGPGRPDDKGDSKTESTEADKTEKIPCEPDTKGSSVDKTTINCKEVTKRSSSEMSKKRGPSSSQEKESRPRDEKPEVQKSSKSTVPTSKGGVSKTQSEIKASRGQGKDTKSNVQSDKSNASDTNKTSRGSEHGTKRSTKAPSVATVEPSSATKFPEPAGKKTIAKSGGESAHSPAVEPKQAGNEKVMLGGGNDAKKPGDEEGDFGHIKRAAENLVADIYAEDVEATEREGANRVTTDPEDSNKWFYRDPQGDLQGPFTSSEMAEWFSAGYFTMNLLVKRGCDETFHPLGELIKRWGRVPFHATRNSPIPAQPAGAVSTGANPVSVGNGAVVGVANPAVSLPLAPMLNPPAVVASPSEVSGAIGEAQQDHVNAMLQQAAVQQQQFIHQQALIRQMQLQQILHSLQQQHDDFSKLPPQQQQQLALQLLLKQQQAAMLQSTPMAPIPQATAAMSIPNTAPQAAPIATTSSLPSKPNQRPVEEGSVSNKGWPAQSPPDGWSQPASIWDIDTRGKSVEKKLEGEVKDHRELERQEFERQREVERKRQEDIEERQRELEQQAEKERLQELERQRELRRQKEERIREHQQELERQQEVERMKEVEQERQREMERRQEMERQRLMEQEAQRRDEERRRMEEERRKAEEKRRKEEERQRQEEERRKAEEERRRRDEEEKQRLQEEQRQEEIRRRQEKAEELRKQQEALRRIQRQQLANMQLPSTAQWGSSGNSPSSNSQSRMTLAEIQAIEAEKERKQQEEREKMELQRQQLEQQQQQQQKVSWTNSSSSVAVGVNPTSPSGLSLVDIQQEQALQLREEQHRKQANKVDVPIVSASAWGGGGGGSSANWASEGTWGAAPKISSTAGFWEEPQRPAPAKKPSSNSSTNSHFPALHTQSNSVQTSSAKVRASKVKKEEETVQRLFKSHKPQDDFTLWCESALKDLQTTVDIPTFVAFLKDVESPYEVHEYVRNYLEDSSEASQFATQFIERRSRHKNQMKQPQEEVMSGPAPALNPFQQQQQQQQRNSNHVDTVGNGATGEDTKAKKKKKKMQKLDPSILGFSVHAAPDRVNIGQIDTEIPTSGTS